MSGPCCLLAIALLTVSPNEPIPVIDSLDWPVVRAALHSLAVEWEILDPREDRLNRLEDLGVDLKLLRSRYRELKDAPPLCDCARFPDRKTINALLSVNRSYRRYLENRLAIDHDRAAPLRVAVRQLDDLHQIWDLAREASCGIYYTPVRRLALLKLREALGDVAYAAAAMPPHVPH